MSAKSFLFSLLVSVFCSSVSCAHSVSRLQTGRDGLEISLEDSIRQVRPGDIVIVGELHGNATCQKQQVDLLQALRAQGLKVSVGMEFLDYPLQPLVDDFRSGKISEVEFLAKVGWGKGISFDFYKEQVQFPNLAEGSKTWALNIPRTVTSQVAKKGIDSLSQEQKQLLPPGLAKGNARYFERFKSSIGHLPNPEAAERYFWAQSIWDDTMAWRALSFLEAAPEQVLVIVVGEFHVQFGGGLPDRLKARGLRGQLHTFSQIDLAGLSPQERAKELQPDPQDGPRADYLFTFERSEQRKP